MLTRHRLPARLVSIGALMLTLTTSTLAMPGDRDGACPAEAPRPHVFGERQPPAALPPPFLHRVNLSDEQKDRIFELMYQQMPLLRQHEIKTAHALDALRKLGASPSFDVEQARKLANAASASQGEILLLRAQTEQKIYLLLTPEQRQAAEIAGQQNMPR